jgi:hypothetical protein
MQAQKNVPISSAQYWLYQLKHLPPSALLVLNVFFGLVFFLFAIKYPAHPGTRYPGVSDDVQPTIQVLVPPSRIPPARVEPSPLPPAISHPDPIGGVFVPEEPVATAEQEIPPTAVQPTADTEATAEAWVLAPPSTPTSSPAPGEPGFAESFQYQPECNLFIGYVGKKRAHCAAVYAAQTEEALP